MDEDNQDNQNHVENGDVQHTGMNNLISSTQLEDKYANVVENSYLLNDNKKAATISSTNFKVNESDNEDIQYNSVSTVVSYSNKTSILCCFR